MDNGKGSFDAISAQEFEEAKKEPVRAMGFRRIDKMFVVGEKVHIKASAFQVRSIDHMSGIIVLKLLPRE